LFIEADGTPLKDELPAPNVLHVLMLPDFERADGSGGSRADRYIVDKTMFDPGALRTKSWNVALVEPL
jgi:hypothetical protein